MIRTEDYKRELVSIFFAQKHLIFWTTFIIFVGAVMVAYSWPPTYSASGSILVSGKQLSVDSPEALESPDRRVLEVSKEDLSSEVEILKSPDVIRNTIKYLSVEYPSYKSVAQGDKLDSDTVYSISRNLDITLLPASNVISIEYFNRDPKIAVDVLWILMEQYIINRMKFYGTRDTALSTSFLENQISRVMSDLDANEETLVSLVDSTGISSPADEIANNIVLKKRLEADLNILRNEYIETKSNLGYLKEALEARDVQYFSFLDNDLMTGLSIKLSELLDLRRTQARTYLPESTVVKSIDEQIEETFASLKGEATAYMGDIQQRLDGTAEKIENMERTIAQYTNQNVALRKQVIATRKIERELGLLEFSFANLSKRKEEVGLNDSLAPSDSAGAYVSILSAAFPSDGPVFPHPPCRCSSGPPRRPSHRLLPGFHEGVL